MAGEGRTARGFTLLELMVVVSVIGLLAAIAVPQLMRTHRRGREAVLAHDLRTMRELIQQYKVDKKKLPETLQALVDEGYLRQIPEDPMTSSRDSWIEEHKECDDPDDPNCDSGVVDVKSGAPGTDLDGKPFAEY